MSLTFCLAAQAQTQQMVDVTSQYIPNAGFEECEALPTAVYHDNQKNVDVNVVNVYPVWNEEKGYDYEETGWKLVEQLKNANGGVITYGCNVWTSKYSYAGEPGAASGVTGSKGLCFTGNNALVYQQANEVTLPKGFYKLTVNLYARNGQTTNKGETVQVSNVKTGFMPTGGAEEDLIPAERKSLQFPNDTWCQEVLEIELTKVTKGRFQISYGTPYFVVVDDIKLEYFDGVITTALSNVLVKAKALNVELNSSTLSSAIATAEAFIANPTDQDDVEPQVTALKNAMAAALTASTQPVNITAAYVENASFESGDQWWDGYGYAQEPINELSLTYIDGNNIYDYTSAGTNTLYQTLENMPAGYYLLDAKLNRKAQLVVNTKRTDCTGGLEHVFLRVHAAVQQLTTAGQLKIGSRGDVAYKIDDFRLFYAKDEASLLALELAAVKADATAILNGSEFASVTGSERTALSTAINGTDIAAINTGVNNLVTAAIAYPKLEKAKQNAAVYTMADYPYALKSYYDQIQALIDTEATTAENALEMATQLDNLCFQFYVSNFYCEGVEKNDLTESMPTSYGGYNMASRSDIKGWKNPKTGSTPTAVLGVKSDYPKTSSEAASYLRIQLPTSIPEGTFVISMTMMGSTNLPIDVYLSKSSTTLDSKIGTIVGHGTASGGKYGVGWNDYAVQFNRTSADNYIFLYCKPTENYKEWYVGNFRLYQLTYLTGIETVENSVKRTRNTYYDLQGRRIAKPAKGLYILNGKKVFLK